MKKKTVGEVTRQRIVQAARKILVNQGFNAITHRSVAEEAGVPLGSTTYHFKDKSELISEALRQLLELEGERRLRVSLPDKTTPEQLSNYLLELLVPPGFRSRKRLGIIYERMVEASRTPKLNKIIAEDQRKISFTLGKSLATLGVEISPDLVQALFDGRVIQWINSTESFDSLEQSLRQDITFLLGV